MNIMDHRKVKFQVQSFPHPEAPEQAFPDGPLREPSGDAFLVPEGGVEFDFSDRKNLIYRNFLSS